MYSFTLYSLFVFFFFPCEATRLYKGWCMSPTTPPTCCDDKQRLMNEWFPRTPPPASPSLMRSYNREGPWHVEQASEVVQLDHCLAARPGGKLTKQGAREGVYRLHTYIDYLESMGWRYTQQCSTPAAERICLPGAYSIAGRRVGGAMRSVRCISTPPPLRHTRHASGEVFSFGKCGRYPRTGAHHPHHHHCALAGALPIQGS